jgi:hypothetical protein
MSLDGRLELAALMREWLSLSGMDLNAAPPMLLEDDL